MERLDQAGDECGLTASRERGNVVGWVLVGLELLLGRTTPTLLVKLLTPDLPLLELMKTPVLSRSLLVLGLALTLPAQAVDE